MKNYYEELEVSKTASKEVIEKVYKVLAKKYHPDTTTESDKIAAEEKFKAISEAYEILSNDEKREKYDLELEQSNPTISYEEYINVVNQRDALSNSLNNLKNEFYQFKNSNNTNQYYNNNHIPYNQVNSNLNNTNDSYNSSNNYQNTNQNYSNQNTNSQKRTYYYTNTGEPASAFDYFKYKIKEFFHNIGLLVLAIFAILLFINAILSFNIFSFFIK